jgi:hypothetical protein
MAWSDSPIKERGRTADHGVRPFAFHNTIWPRSDMAFITPGFFKTMGIPILKGRDFSKQDRANSLPVYIVNEAFANRFFPGQDPISANLFGRQ